MMEWTREIPTKPGYYLRVNAGHHVQLHHVYKNGRHLYIWWGWGGDEAEMNSMQKKWKHKLSGWQWYGPIPEPTIPRGRNDKPANSGL